MPKTQKLTYEEVSKFFEENGCEMLDDHYVNARTHIRYRCSCGNEPKIIFDSFRRGHRCKKCATENNAKRQKFSYDYVRKFFEDHGCELLEGEYIDSHTKMKFRCACGRISYKTFNDFHTRDRCPKCGIIRRSGANHYMWKEDRKQLREYQVFRDRCYKLLRHALDQTGQSKTSKTYSMLGYTSGDLKRHIQSHPNWKNVKHGKWHIDHIFPIQAFVSHGIRDVSLINSLDNLQPLTSTQNISKSGNYSEDEFNKWLKERISC
jgi:hypothetical protein